MLLSIGLSFPSLTATLSDLKGRMLPSYQSFVKSFSYPVTAPVPQSSRRTCYSVYLFLFENQPVLLEFFFHLYLFLQLHFHNRSVHFIQCAHIFTASPFRNWLYNPYPPWEITSQSTSCLLISSLGLVSYLLRKTPPHFLTIPSPCLYLFHFFIALCRPSSVTSSLLSISIFPAQLLIFL